eukprot:1145231-Pelagomonas_calceolata.AAC.1
MDSRDTLEQQTCLADCWSKLTEILHCIIEESYISLEQFEEIVLYFDCPCLPAIGRYFDSTTCMACSVYLLDSSARQRAQQQKSKSSHRATCSSATTTHASQDQRSRSTRAQLNVSNTLHRALTFGHVRIHEGEGATGGQALLTVLLVRAARAPNLS